MKDKSDLKKSLSLEYDYVAVSFVKDDKDINDIRKIIRHKDIKIIAKIERNEAIKNIDKITSGRRLTSRTWRPWRRNWDRTTSCYAKVFNQKSNII